MLSIFGVSLVLYFVKILSGSKKVYELLMSVLILAQSLTPVNFFGAPKSGPVETGPTDQWLRSCTILYICIYGRKRRRIQ